MTRSDVMGRPLELAGRTLRNRIVATAHGIAAVEDGIPDDTDAAYWSRLARGGPAMVITGGVQVSKETTLRTRYLGEAWHPWSARGFRKRVDAIAAGGAVPVVQLGHLGRETLGASYFYPFEAPSAVRGPREPVAARVMSADDIRDVARSFGESARQMVAAGYEGIEIHGAHGYLIAQFLSRRVNVRTDRYGGDVVGRATALVEIIEQIRGRAPDAILGVRFSVENDEGGLTVGDIAEVAGVIRERAAVDYLNVSFGNRGYYVRDMATSDPPLRGVTSQLAAEAGVPLLVSSSFRTRDQIEYALTSGGASLVGMARPFIADPDVAMKLLTGRDDEIRPCVSCNEDCRSFDPTAMCSINPDLAPPGESRKPGEPVLLSIGAPARDRRVAVVGAGPAGLECATSLARRGCQVMLLEAAQAIGGQLRTAAMAPTRTGWSRLIDYYGRQLDALGVDCRFGVAAAGPQVADKDVVVWAVGARESSELLGTEAPPTVDSSAFLDSGRARCPIVLDDGFGWWPMVSVVESALARGAERVTVVSPGAGFAGTIPAESRLQLMERLRGSPLRILVASRVVASDRTGVVVATNGSAWTERIETDLCVSVGERVAQPVPRLDEITTWAIGDCVMPRRVSHAIAEGRAAALRVVAYLEAGEESEWSSSPARSRRR